MKPDVNSGHGRLSSRGLLFGAAIALVAVSVQIAVAGESPGPQASPAANTKKQIKKLKQRVGRLEARPDQGDVIPAGLVAHFNLASCPAGWSELGAARGRYLVGVPAGGTIAGTAGTALSNQEDRAVGQHTHGITDPGHLHAHNSPLGDVDVTEAGAAGLDASNLARFINIATESATTGISVNGAGAVAGTNAPYLQLLACQKG